MDVPLAAPVWGQRGGRPRVLSTIAGSMMTVVGVTFSMVLVTLALASSQYSSRILRNFMRDRVTQVVLGIFAGVFTYCLIVLRTIRGGDAAGSIPSLAVTIGVVLAIGGIGALIFFIHHIAASIQASSHPFERWPARLSPVRFMHPHSGGPMSTLLIIVVLLLVFGGGGWGYSRRRR